MSEPVNVVAEMRECVARSRANEVSWTNVFVGIDVGTLAEWADHMERIQVEFDEAVSNLLGFHRSEAKLRDEVERLEARVKELEARVYAAESEVLRLQAELALKGHYNDPSDGDTL